MVTNTRSKLASAAIVVMTLAIVTSPRSAGSVTVKNFRTGPPPSSATASYSAVSTFCTPDRNSTMHSPLIAQVPMRPSAISAVS